MIDVQLFCSITWYHEGKQRLVGAPEHQAAVGVWLGALSPHSCAWLAAAAAWPCMPPSACSLFGFASAPLPETLPGFASALLPETLPASAQTTLAVNARKLWC